MPELSSFATASSRSPITTGIGIPSPEEIAAHLFPNARRGYDPDTVRAFLQELAANWRFLLDQIGSLETRLHEEERRVATPVLDEQTLSAALGAETARVLTVAHEAAHEIVAKAEARATALIEDTEAAIADRSRTAHDESERLLAGSRSQIDEMRADAEEACRAMVREARDARHKILTDLAVRRRALHLQLEQLRAGKDALSGVVSAVANSVAAVQHRLDDAENEARAAADDASRTAPSEIDSRSIEEVVAEVLAAAIAAPTPVLETATTDYAEAPTELVDPEPETEPGAEAAIAHAEVSTEVSVPETESTAAAEPDLVHGPLDELFARLRADQEALEAIGEEIGSDLDVLHPDAPISIDGQRKAVEVAIDATVEVAIDAAIKATESAGSAEDITTTTADANPNSTAGLELIDTAPDESAALLHGDVEEPESPHDVEERGRRAELFQPAFADLARALKRTIRVEQNELLDACRNVGPAGDVGALFALDGAADRIAQASLAAIFTALESGASFIASSASPERGELVHAADEVAGALGAELAAAVARRLRKGSDEVASEDFDPIALANAVFREWRGARVEDLAGDYITRSFALGSLATARAGNVAVRWVVDDGPVDCPDCDDNALAGALSAGELFPTGHACAPVHPGCRCMLLVGS